MSRFPLSSKGKEATFTPLESNTGFLLNLEGRKVITLKVPSKVAKEISGQEPQTSGGVLSRLKTKLGFTPDTEQWLTVTSVDNPLLAEYDKFGALVAQQLTTATGTEITKANLAISASVPITGPEQAIDNVESDRGLPERVPIGN